MEDYYTETPEKRKQYNPYKDINMQYHPTCQRLYDLPTSPEHLFEEEKLRTRRDLTSNLTHYTGCLYASGAVVGSLKGARVGLRAAERGDSVKIRTNRVLNSGGMVGRNYGCNAGICGLMYGVLENRIATYRNSDDMLTSVFAGVGTGFLFRVLKGFRSASIGGAAGGVAVAAAVAGGRLLRRYVPGLPSI